MAGPRHIDALVAEIGSTTTVVSAFDGLVEGGAPQLLGQGFAPTSVAAGDVGVGVEAARTSLEATTGPIDPRVTLATSSAAGGLRMTVHGLTQKMTAMAAREAALGAGGVVELTTAGRLSDHDLTRIAAAAPGLILLAGGVEGGDSEVVLHNAARLAEITARPIVVYGGNSAAADEARATLERAGFRVRVTANVYPGVDELDIVPARHAIHDAFEEHITHAPGMERIGEFVTGPILPTPGAVLIAAELLADTLGDLVVIDVGGATTDVHSVTDGTAEIAAIATDPQPHAKRTVEGDLGTYVSAAHVAALLPEAGRPDPLPPAVPSTAGETAAAALLARTAARVAVERHAGQLTYLYTPRGRQTVARGRDLTACRLVIGTGGALTRLPDGTSMLEGVRASAAGGERLLPPADARVVLDRDYVLAACGALSTRFRAGSVLALMRSSLGL
ncbi:MAG: glutamate mutase L [Coriobacteriia bacterium]|nr:glutamate mutase L [Coriobacteriia bacterium]MBN2848948.1 glutamate mutase L [Coriobacteriia bacterium]